jgi:hypothetical protein
MSNGLEGSGRVVSVRGSVIDVRFERGDLDVAWRLTHTAFVDPEAGSAADSIRNFLERVIARELDLPGPRGVPRLRCGKSAPQSRYG